MSKFIMVSKLLLLAVGVILIMIIFTYRPMVSPVPEGYQGGVNLTQTPEQIQEAQEILQGKVK